ncbi:MAG: hypothetical protein HY897_02880 [Deltaproteobacteria bacterium]|nr:hypothetical protein [Deltaproteobacteria bacterium]
MKKTDKTRIGPVRGTGPVCAVPAALALLVCAAPFAHARAPADATGDGAPGGPAPMHRLTWGVPTECMTDPAGNRWRVQCDKPRAPGAKPVCLAAPATQSNGKPLSRVKPCRETGTDGYKKMTAAESAIIPAIAEAPPGWYRDEEGRVMQVTFDLQRRFVLGAGWAPALDAGGGGGRLGRSQFDMGFAAAWPDEPGRRWHVIRALEGHLAVPDLEAGGQFFAYDMSQLTDEPVLRITTFFGRPRRGDLRLDWGLGLRVLGLDVRPHGVPGVTDLEIAEFHLAWDIWQSADMYNRVRASGGTAVGRVWQKQEPGRGWSATYLEPGAALTWYHGLDRGGFHTLSADLHWSAPCYYRDEGFVPRTRAGTNAGYEWILIAVNDQPVSLRIEGTLDYRDDLGAADPKWETAAHAGLRFSFWAPAREHAAAPIHTRRHADDRPAAQEDSGSSE